MTTNQVLLGVGVVLVLAAGAQVAASKLRIPALILLLPAGFTAGAITSDVNPAKLLGPAFGPLVSLAVAVILYDAGLGLDLRKLTRHSRRVATRLIFPGILITAGFGVVATRSLLGISWDAAIMLGAILVVSGPTVVGPLLDFVRPSERVQRVLAWEGSLVDPVGGILGAVVFHAVISSTSAPGLGHPVARFAGSLAIGLTGGIVGTGLLWLLLSRLKLGEVLGTTAQFAAVIGVAAACDILREDTGLIAAIVMGLSAGNLARIDVPVRRPFFETLVQLIIGVLFVVISATVAPSSILHLILPTLGVVAVLVLVARPVTAAVATIGSSLSAGERAFVGWMAPRGIVAAATATTFSATLISARIGGAAKILPATFLVIVATVSIYGLSASPVARRLGVLTAARSRPLLVGADPWVIDLGRTLRSAGLDVLLWAGPHRDRDAIENAGLSLADDELLATAAGEGAQLEGVTAVLLLTDEDDFNELASVVLPASVDGPVHYIGPPSPGAEVVQLPAPADRILFGDGLNRPDLTRRFAGGERISTWREEDVPPGGHDTLFLIRTDGRLVPVTHAGPPPTEPGDTRVTLGPAA